MTDVPAPAHDDAYIAQSGELLAINHLIDQYRDTLLHRQHSIKARMEHLLSTVGNPPPGAEPRVSTRTSREEGQDEFLLLFDNHELKQLAELIQMTHDGEKMIGELQRYKLRLLNDYDFTHGDPAQQWAVFGPPPEVTGDFVFLLDDGEGLFFPMNDLARRHLVSNQGKRERGRSGVVVMVNGEEVRRSGRGYFSTREQTRFLLDFLRASGFTVTVHET